MAVKKTKRAIKEADLIFFLLDLSSLGIVREDLSIASFLEENAKALIVLLNKCDLIPARQSLAGGKEKQREEYLMSARRALQFLNFAPFIFTSGLTGENLDTALKKAKEIILAYQKPIKQTELQETLNEIKAKRLPKQGPRIYDLKQDRLNPNTITLRTNNPSGIDKTYLRFITNFLHQKFGLEGIPIVIKMRSTKFRRRK